MFVAKKCGNLEISINNHGKYTIITAHTFTLPNVDIIYNILLIYKKHINKFSKKYLKSYVHIACWNVSSYLK